MQYSDESLRSLRVLVTGASGFLGVSLCKRLIKAGAVVHAVTRRIRQSDKIHWWQTDLVELDATRRLLSEVKPDVVFHLSGAITGAEESNWFQRHFTAC
ncbi:MAG: NAD-dependent epimerase/dehydratase family protein [Planctomycetes bacterium]|nr:NAD-dependent epimerase/dehydratase family protein [Planctomycetota bacterium]